MKKIACLLLTVCMNVALFGCGFTKEPEQNNEQETQQSLTADVTENTDTADLPQNTEIVITIKDYGSITVLLDAKAAPITVSNFLKLVEEGFYDGLTFHRIMSGFMIQGGDPKGDGTGGSDTEIKGEFSVNGVDNPLSHTRGAISMARARAYDSASSQFFIVHEDSTFLDGQYACFGYVTEGMEVVDAICESVPAIDNNGTVLKDNQPIIESIRINQQ